MEASPRSTSSRLLWSILALLVCVPVSDVAAQSQQAQPAAVYRFAEPGEPTMQVRVWGAVRAPGVYQVPRATDVVGLISLAGGPIQYAESPNVERTYHVHVMRETEGARQLILELPLSDVTRTAAPLPALNEGDVVSVEVETRQRFGWRDGLAIASSIGTVAVIVLNIIRLSN